MSSSEKTANVDVTAILVVVPTLNEEAHIESCVRSLMRGDDRLRDITVAITDGGSTDRTREIVTQLQNEFQNLELLHNPKKLQSAAINLAAARLSNERTKFLIRCDAHSIYPDNFILDVAQSLVSKDAESVVIPMDAVGTTCFEKANAWIVDTPLGSGGAAHRGGTISGYVDHGHHAGFLLSAFLDTGGYDETFSHNEDAEYDERLRARGGRIYLDANIRIKYVPRGNLKSLAKQYFNYGKGRARNIAKHRQSLRPRQLIPVIALVGNLVGLIFGMFWWPLLLLPLGYVSILAAASTWIALSKGALCGLWAGPALGAMHMSWAAGFIRQKFSEKPTKSLGTNYISQTGAK